MTREGFRTSDFDYRLPPELIAQEPLPDRSGSRLLILSRTRGDTPELEDRSFADLPSLIPAGDLLVLNTTRVRHARLLGRRKSGAPAEILLIHPAADGHWVVLGNPAVRFGPVSELRSAPAPQLKPERCSPTDTG